MAETKRELVDEIYDHVLQTVNRALHNAQNYSIAILKLEDPSYEEIAKQLRNACAIMDLLAEELERTAPQDGEPAYTVAKAREYTETVAKIAEAINTDDEATLRQLCKELERRPFK